MMNFVQVVKKKNQMYTRHVLMCVMPWHVCVSVCRYILTRIFVLYIYIHTHTYVSVKLFIVYLNAFFSTVLHTTYACLCVFFRCICKWVYWVGRLLLYCSAVCCFILLTGAHSQVDHQTEQTLFFHKQRCRHLKIIKIYI